jgi:hypothetical protein
MLDIDALRERREREWRQRVLAIVDEFGARPHRLLVPEDDPRSNPTVLRLAAEVLFLRDQIKRIATAVEWAQAGEPFELIPPRPRVTYSRRSTRRG